MSPRIAIVGSGSWATALAKIVLAKQPSINWFIRRQQIIDEFMETGRNPGYLSTASFDISRIRFTTDINAVIAQSDILIIAIPSPYLKQVFTKIRRSLRNKIVVNAVKGMIPEENLIVTDYLQKRFHIPAEQLGVIAGPCHAEEIALERLSYLTIGCQDPKRAHVIADLFTNDYVRTTVSTDVNGLEYCSVMKNIYATAAGLCQALHYGDNFQAVLLSNAIQEMQRFTEAVSPACPRTIDASAYLGDLLVTAYSKFSRNRQFGQMLGMGYSVRAAQLEMEMVAEGYYGTRAIYLANRNMHVSLPIVDAMYDIIFNQKAPAPVIRRLTEQLV